MSVRDIASEHNLAITDCALASLLDKQDPLAPFREDFCIPKAADVPEAENTSDKERHCVYLCGNSLGLQPRGTAAMVNEELDKWSKLGVIGHFDSRRPRPWVDIGEICRESMGRVVGASANEVVIMNSLTTNLHLMLVSFYAPTPQRHKIIIEEHAFPSDHYAIESQIRFHKLDPSTSMILAKPREGEETLRTEDIVALIEEHRESLALVMFSGVQYYTGQLFDMKTITSAAKGAGARVGFDLAHAVGNAQLSLHEWGVDFAAWCSYKYLNSGPGGIAGAFLHSDHFAQSLPMFAGWWGNNPTNRFQMINEFDAIADASRYQLSNPPVLQTVSLRASLDIFDRTSMAALTAKSRLLTGYLEALLLAQVAGRYRIITPSDPAQRGCQLSIEIGPNVRPVHAILDRRGFVCDVREPHVIRVAPCPLYNTFADVYSFATALGSILEEQEKKE